MDRRSFARAAAACMVFAAASASAASWRPVPGASELDIDVASFQQERTRVSAWLRWPGRSPLLVDVAAQVGPAGRLHRTAVRTEFDCARRTVRVLAAQGFDRGGAPLFMASVPGPVRAVAGADLSWAYEAACEAARSAGRL
ncbi:hypothetical protein JJB11_25480 [Ramlibacter ginsenosidimutans]|uniref:Uncharacterized protein n=1 Tax=Ramlibacter ginsenosidimutans TaxID=502333 RepID=A0A934TXH9_9BURK|nr:hypothetical protein [Ramlibacter ginsenosidimutans]MBK6009464.1 hypothetical protein [Ramlibacter ginsenosidimutans]